MNLDDFSEDERRQFAEYLDHARTDMFPKMKGSVFSIIIASEDPDPKLCLELGAAILFDKPIMLAVPRGRKIPLGLRTIAHRIVEVSNPLTDADKQAMTQAVNDMLEASRFRGPAAKEQS